MTQWTASASSEGFTATEKRPQEIIYSWSGSSDENMSSLETDVNKILGRLARADFKGDTQETYNLLKNHIKNDKTGRLWRWMIHQELQEHEHRHSLQRHVFESMQLHPEDPYLLQVHGSLAEANGNEEEARHVDEKLKTLGIHHKRNLIRGQAYLALKRFDKAREALSQANDLDKETFDYHYALGNISFWERKSEEAIRHYEKAAERYPKNQALFHLAQSYDFNREHDKSMKILKKIKDEYHWEAEEACALANHHRIRGNNMKAMTLYNEALTLFENSPIKRSDKGLKHNYAETFRQRGHLLRNISPKESLEDFKRAVALDFEETNVYTLTKELLEQGSPEAEEHVKIFRGEFPKSEYQGFITTLELSAAKKHSEAFHHAVQSSKVVENIPHKINKYAYLSNLDSVVRNTLKEFTPEEAVAIIRKELDDQDAYSAASDYAVTILDNIGEEEASEEAITKTFSLLKKSFQHQQKSIDEITRKITKESRNDVRELKTNEFSPNLYLLKAPKDEGGTDGNKELAVQAYIKETIKRKGLDIEAALPLGMLNLDGKDYMVQKAKKGRNLDDMLSAMNEGILGKKEVIQAFNRANFNMQQLHIHTYKALKEKDHTIVRGREEHKLERTNYLQEVHERLVRRVGGGSEAKNFLEAYQHFLEDYQEEFDFFIHNDFYATNILDNQERTRKEKNPINQTTIIIDYEKASIGNPLRDFYSLMTHPILAIHGFEPHHIHEKQARALADQMIKHTGNDYFESSEKLYERLMAGAKAEEVHNSICQIGSKLNQGHNPKAQWYLQHALKTMPDKLKDPFVKYIRSTGNDTLKEAL